ncbi:MAG: ABC transporter permease, partial [Bacteroidota bacterium]
MLRTTLLIALRNLRRHRGFALLNIAGLALGLACVLLIALFVRDELLVDQYHENAERIVRLQVDMIEDGRVDPSGNTQGDLAPALVREMPEVETAVRFFNADPVIRSGETVLQAEGGLLYTDPDVLEVFSYPLLAGSASGALAEPGAIVLTETLAQSLFGTTDVTGETVIAGGKPLTVTAVMEDVPRQSHFTFDGLISLETMEAPDWLYGNWFAVGFTTFALLREGVSPEAFEAKLPAFAQAAAGDAMAETGTDLVFKSRPLTDLYLTATLGQGTFGSASTLRILMFVALFVLIVAGVNFTNLAMARSLDRAREVGVRKTLGAMRSGLAAQFLAEAVVLSLASLVRALGLAQGGVPGVP